MAAENDFAFDYPTDVEDLQLILMNMVAQSLGSAYFFVKKTFEWLVTRILLHDDISLQQKRQFVFFGEAAFSKIYYQFSSGATNRQLAKTAFVAVLLRRMTRLIRPVGWSLPTVEQVFRVGAKEEDFANSGITLPEFKMPSDADLSRIDIHAQGESLENQDVEVEPSGCFFTSTVTELGIPPCPKPSPKSLHVAEVAEAFSSHVKQYMEADGPDQDGATSEAPRLVAPPDQEPKERFNPKGSAEVPNKWRKPEEARTRRRVPGKDDEERILDDIIDELDRPFKKLHGVRAKQLKAKKAVAKAGRTLARYRRDKRLEKRGMMEAVVVLRQEKENCNIGIPVNARELSYALRQCKMSASGASYYGGKMLADFSQLLGCRPSIQQFSEAFYRLQRLDNQLMDIRERGDSELLEIFMGSRPVRDWGRLPSMWTKGTAKIIDVVCDNVQQDPATIREAARGSAACMERVNKYFGSLEKFFSVILQDVLVDDCMQEDRVDRMNALVRLIK